MKLASPKSLAAVGVALLVAGFFAAPAFVSAFTLIGSSLGMATSGNGYQRDFRVWNNSNDTASNGNTTPDTNYPGATGAVLACWKGAKAWASENPLAARNFDYDFQGTTTSNPSNGNVIGWGDTGCSGGTLAYTETPVDDGWRIVMCDTNWVWDDGPTTSLVGGSIDMQGVVAHEIGHALGMGHSATGCGGSSQPTMCPAIFGSGTGQRTIESDDQAGLQAIYGTIPANKPVITGLSGGLVNGGIMTITGTNFAGTVNVKFTAGGNQNTGSITGTVYNVPSSAGGTQISVLIPAAAQDGNVLVWEPALGLSSNAFPINLSPPPAPTITGFNPQSVQAFAPALTTITGTGFTGATSVTVGAASATFTVVNDTTITFTPPTPTALGNTIVVVTNPTGQSLPSFAFVYTETNPARLTASGTFTATNQNFTWIMGGGANDNMYLIASLDPTTTSFGTPFQFLMNYTQVAYVQANAVGIGTYTLHFPPGFGGLTFYSQIASFDDLGNGFTGSNVISTAVIF